MNNYAFKTYSELFTHIVNGTNNPTFLNYLHKNEYISISTKEFENRVLSLALALKEYGIKKNQSVAIFAKSSPCWLIFDFALQLIHAVSVPIFADISQKNLDFEIKDSNIEYIFTDHEEYQYEIDDEITIIGCNIKANNKKFITVNALYKRGEQIQKETPSKIDELFENQLSEDDLFSVVYTSGNTGMPKGVELTQKNIISQLHDINEFYAINEKDRALSLLPLAHIFERAVMSFYLSCSVSVYFVDDVSNVAVLMQKVQPTIMTVVPRLLEKIYAKMQARVDETQWFKHFLATQAMKRALYKNQNEYNFLDFVYQKLVYTKFLKSFGGALRILVTGGASLDRDLYNFFVNIGLPLYQGYGLTESSPVICVNYPHNNKVGTSGKVLKSITVKLASDGELLAKSPGIMRGYRNQQELTNETIDIEGWLHTGDLALIDDEGYITIKSRKKELLKTSTGEYVSAIAVEQAITKSHYIDFAVVIANNRQYVTALLFVDLELAKESTQNLNVEEFYAQDEIKNAIQNDIENANKELNKWERVIKYKIVTNAISIDTGELTPSMKIRRNEIEKKYSDLIKSMY
ncbi:MAG: AMP-dependent synthetase/ligase [Candidatus Marinarcus sp.]|uniref:AMP-dependent synthetase/ligase n=1 Tax=Candidatus Marinarcus sp. TaxID=3100987 RepID=UPI003B00ED41